MATIPIILLREAVGHVVVVELNTKDEYRGTLKSAEDSMNVILSKVTHTSRVGQKSTLEEVYLRGSAIRLFVLPELLINAPVLRTVAATASAAAASSHSGAKKAQQQPKSADGPSAKRQRMGS
jgi:small nuclear ribonucleoprotein D3